MNDDNDGWGADDAPSRPTALKWTPPLLTVGGPPPTAEQLRAYTWRYAESTKGRIAKKAAEEFAAGKIPPLLGVSYYKVLVRFYGGRITITSVEADEPAPPEDHYPRSLANWNVRRGAWEAYDYSYLNASEDDE